MFANFFSEDRSSWLLIPNPKVGPSGRTGNVGGIVQVQQEQKESRAILSAVVDWISILAGVDRMHVAGPKALPAGPPGGAEGPAAAVAHDEGGGPGDLAVGEEAEQSEEPHCHGTAPSRSHHPCNRRAGEVVWSDVKKGRRPLMGIVAADKRKKSRCEEAKEDTEMEWKGRVMSWSSLRSLPLLPPLTCRYMLPSTVLYTMAECSFSCAWYSNG
ncbi:hypothetical protein BHM03_00015652 [Ensete ventricosum]|nr:hypothetical protein BHM03_00015652 [Ensete ventricosum]